MRHGRRLESRVSQEQDWDTESKTPALEPVYEGKLRILKLGLGCKRKWLIGITPALSYQQLRKEISDLIVKASGKFKHKKFVSNPRPPFTVDVIDLAY